MRDFKALVRKQVEALRLPAEREEKVIEELAALLEDAHAAILREGLSDEAAWQELLRRTPPLAELLDEVLRAEPVIELARAERRFLSSGLGLDFRASLRRLRQNPAFTLTAILTFAVCLGANAAIFTIVNKILLNPLPVPDPSRIMLMANQFPNAGVGVAERMSAPRNYFDRLRGVEAFAEQAMFNVVDRVVRLGDRPVQMRGVAATPSLFPLIGVEPALGRTFAADEEEVGNDQRVVLSYGLWQELYAGDAAVLGTDLRVGGVPFTIVGVMPEDFAFVAPDARFWIPLAFTPPQKNNSIANNYYNVGRLRPGATREQAQQQVDAVNAAFLAEVPRLKAVYEDAGYHTTVEPLEDVLTRDVRRLLHLLWGGAIVVLLVGGINIANLTLAQSRLRVREMATRLALGAGRARLAASFVGEMLTVALAGGVLGLVLGAVALRAVGSIRADQLLMLDELTIGAPVAAFVLLLAVVVGAVVGVAPLKDLNRINLTDAIHDNSRTGTAGRRSGWLRRGLVTAQVALTFLLLVGAGSLLLTLRNLLSVDPGFSTQNVVTAAINVRGERYADVASAQAFLDRILEGIRDIPGVTSAAATTFMPLSGGGGRQAVIAEGQVTAPDESILAPSWLQITPGFFETMGVPFVDGRDFDSRDGESGALARQSTAGVVIVDAAFARTFWPDQDPLGRRIFMPGVRNVLQITDDTRWLSVVGVVPELLLEDLSGNESSVGTFYTLFAETNPNTYPQSYGFVIKTAGDPVTVIASVRREVARIDPELALFDIRTMAERTSLSLARERLAMSLASAFGTVALLLSVLGIYGVLSYLVAQRTRELGIRIALGSTARGIFQLVLREGVGLVVVGLIIGMLGAFVLRPVLASQVFGIQPDHPLLIGGVMAVLVSATLMACVVPARRATRVDPVTVLSQG